MKKHKPESDQLKWLADTLMNEMEKPDEEIDWEYVKLCEILLSSFSPHKKLSKWGIQKRVKNILKRIDNESSIPIENKTKPVFHKIKPAFVALIAAVVLMLSCVTVCATTTFDENILKALNLGINQSFEDEGITYTYHGKSVKYKTIDDLFDTENLNICYPEIFAYNANLLKVHRDETNSYTIFVFDDSRISFEIHHGAQPDPAQFDDAEIVEFNNYIFYVLGETKDLAVAIINNNFYNLHCEDKNQLLEMIYSFNFERIE